MRFLIDASVPRSAEAVLRRLGHEAADVRDLGLGSATDDIIAAHARSTESVLVTRDFDFADVRNYPPADFKGIVVLHLEDDAPASRVVAVLEALVARDDWAARIMGRLVIVESRRVRFRPA